MPTTAMPTVAIVATCVSFIFKYPFKNLVYCKEKTRREQHQSGIADEHYKHNKQYKNQTKFDSEGTSPNLFNQV